MHTRRQHQLVNRRFPGCATKCELGRCNKNAFHNGFSDCVQGMCRNEDLAAAMDVIRTDCLKLDVSSGQDSLAFIAKSTPSPSSQSSFKSPTASTSSFFRAPASITAIPQTDIESDATPQTSRDGQTTIGAVAESISGSSSSLSDSDKKTLVAALVPSVVLATALIVAVILFLRRRRLTPQPRAVATSPTEVNTSPVSSHPIPQGDIHPSANELPYERHLGNGIVGGTGTAVVHSSMGGGIPQAVPESFPTAQADPGSSKGTTHQSVYPSRGFPASMQPLHLHYATTHTPFRTAMHSQVNPNDDSSPPSTPNASSVLSALRRTSNSHPHPHAPSPPPVSPSAMSETAALPGCDSAGCEGSTAISDTRLGSVVMNVKEKVHAAQSCDDKAIEVLERSS